MLSLTILILLLSLWCFSYIVNAQPDPITQYILSGEPDEITKIEAAIAGARDLANTAWLALGDPNVIYSESFEKWFGFENYEQREIIMNSNYGRIQYLSSFLAPVAESFYNGAIVPGSILYDVDYDSGICGTDGYACTNVSPITLPGWTALANVVIICQKFLRSPTMMPGLDEDAAGETILHELQHMPRYTSFTSPLEDVTDPNDPTGRGCYSADCCSRLDYSKKIVNAENYVKFAIDAKYTPERTQGSPCSRPGSLGGIKIREPQRPNFDQNSLIVARNQLRSLNAILGAKSWSPSMPSTRAIALGVSASTSSGSLQMKLSPLSSQVVVYSNSTLGTSTSSTFGSASSSESLKLSSLGSPSTGASPSSSSTSSSSLNSSHLNSSLKSSLSESTSSGSYSSSSSPSSSFSSSPSISTSILSSSSSVPSSSSSTSKSFTLSSSKSTSSSSNLYSSTSFSSTISTGGGTITPGPSCGTAYVSYSATITATSCETVIGGFGGGFYFQGGKDYHVNDGKTQKAGDPQNEPYTLSTTETKKCTATVTATTRTFTSVKESHTKDILTGSEVSGLTSYLTLSMTKSSSRTLTTATSTASSAIATLSTTPQSLPSNGDYAFDHCLFNPSQQKPPGDVWDYGLYVYPTSDYSGTKWFIYVPWVICGDNAYYTVYLNYYDDTQESLYLGGPYVNGTFGEANSKNSTFKLLDYWWVATNATV